MVNHTPQTPTRAAVGLAVHMGQPEPLPTAGFEVIQTGVIFVVLLAGSPT